MQNFENIVFKYHKKINFQQQADWEDNRLKLKQEKHELSMLDIDEKLKKLEKQSTKMYNNLYSVNKPKIERRDSVSFADEIEGQQCQSPDLLVSILVRFSNKSFINL